MAHGLVPKCITTYKMNNRFFDHKMHAVQSARKLLMGLSDKKGHTADELTEKIIVGIINLSTKKVGKEEIAAELFSAINIKNYEVPTEVFDECVNLLAEAFKAGNRNDYQFFWNMLKEGMYCIEAEAEEKFEVILEASTIAYHISNAAKEAVGATGLKYASDQLVF